MKGSIACLSLVAVLALSGSVLAFPGDEYDDSESHPLRTAAYILHPVGVGLEWAVYRPLHWLVSLNETTEYIFGHRPHGAEELRSIECTPIEMLQCTPQSMQAPVSPTMSWTRPSANASSTSVSNSTSTGMSASASVAPY
jgi:hypothetical protein